ALQQQVAGLLEARMLGEIVDRVAAVAQLAGTAIDVADPRAVEVDALQSTTDLDVPGFFGHAQPPLSKLGAIVGAAARGLPARRPGRQAQAVLGRAAVSAIRLRLILLTCLVPPFLAECATAGGDRREP